MNSKSPQHHKRSKSNHPSKQPNHPNPDHPSSSASSSESGHISNQASDQDDDQSPQSFADRLKILNLQAGHPTHNHHPTAESDDHMANKKLKPTNPISITDPSNPIMPVGSLAQTLIQALNSTDTKLLETCFLQSNKSLIAATLHRLPKPLVHSLIEQLVICLNRKKRGAGEGATVPTVRRTKILIEWVRQVLLIHMSYLLTIPTLVTQLSVLHASLQRRLNLHSKLLSLNGRLELVLNQIDLNKTALELTPSIPKINGIKHAKRKTQAVSQIEPFRYVEGESSTSELDPDSNGESSSEDEEADQEAIHRYGSDEEGSVEDVVLGSGSGTEEEDSESDSEIGNPKVKRRINGSEGLLDLEAEVSGSENEDRDEDDDDEDEDEDDEDEMADFIDDGTEDSEEETDDE